MEQKQGLVWRAEVRNVKDLIPWDDNPRKIKEPRLASLIRKVEQHGFHASLAIDTDGTILSGNQRKRVLDKLGIKEVNVLVPNRKLTKNEREKIALESNCHDGEWDIDKLKTFGWDVLIDSGFNQIELVDFWDKDVGTKDDDFDVEKELKKIVEPKTKLGDIITLGRHKLYCADSTKPENLKTLLGDERASMIYSDPVYNIDVDYNGGIGGKQNYGGDVNDKRTFSEYKKFIQDSLESALAVSYDNVHVFYYCDQIYIGLIQDVYRTLGIDNKRVCLWLKNNQNPVPKVAFNKVYEPVVYGVRGKPYLSESVTTLNEVLNKEFTTGNNLLEEVERFVDVWPTKRLPAKSYLHATSKPPILHEKAIKRCSKPNDIILDSFLGSGGLIVCGEQLGRRVYGCDSEPRFCDLIINRFEKLTGIKAKIQHYEEK